MAKKLTNLKITKVSLVDEGACSAAHITLFKNKEGGKAEMNYETVLSSLTEEQQAVIKGKIEELTKTAEEAAAKEENAKAEKEKLEEEKETLAQEKEELEKVAEEKEELSTRVKELEEEVEKLKGENQPEVPQTEDEILKNVDPAVKEMIQKARQEANLHKQAVLKMREEQETAELTEIAKSLTGVGTDETNMVSLLRKAKNADLKLYQDILKAFEVANNIISDSIVMKTVGVTGDQVEGDAWARLDAKAEEIAKERNISKQKATGVVMSEYPELYRNYLNNLK